MGGLFYIIFYKTSFKILVFALLVLWEETCPSKSVCGGAGEALESRGGGKGRLRGDTQGSEKMGQSVGRRGRRDGAGAERMVITAWRLPAEVRREVEAL